MSVLRCTRCALIRSLCAWVAIIGVLYLSAEAHEGHAPLPTKGAEVDVEEGLLTLSAEARDSLGVQTGQVTLRPIVQTVLAYATVSLDWQQHVFVTTPIAGRISRLHIKPGEIVMRGQPLAEIESTEFADLQLQLLDAQNQTELSAATLARVESLVKEKAIAGRELAAAQSTHHENQAALEIAASKLKRLRLTGQQIDLLLTTKQPFRYLPILSPLAGTAIHSDLALGKFVEPTEHLFEVMDLSSVAVRVDVLERDLGKIEPGQKAKLSVTAVPDAVFNGKVSVKEPFIDSSTHLGRVWIKLANPDESKHRLLPGMYGQAEIRVSSAEKKLTVPKRALLTNGTEWFVLVEDAATARASEYGKRNVAVGASNADQAEITAGDVFPGDLVVTTGGHELTNFFIQGVLRLSPEARKNLGVIVQPAKAQYLDEIVEVDGAIELPPAQRAVAASPLGGTIEHIFVNRGQTVRAGDAIADVTSLELLETQYDLLQANVQLELLKETLGRLRPFRDNPIIAGKRLIELESQHQATLLQRGNAQQRLLTLGLTSEQVAGIVNERRLVEFLPVRAPIDGVIVGFDKSLGKVILADQPLFEIHNLTRLVVRAHLSERDTAEMFVGATARVRVVADPTLFVEGKVVRLGGAFGTTSRTASAWIELAAEPVGTLYHDMLARVTLAKETNEPALAVPKNAIVNEATRTFVFVEDAGGLLTRRPVKTGRTDDRWVEITDGLEVGERVAVQGAANLQTAHASLK